MITSTLRIVQESDFNNYPPPPTPRSRQLESFTPLTTWEGRRASLPFTIEAVTDWIGARYRDQVQGRLTGTVGTTLFSLLQSLHYGFPERWPDIIQRLSREVSAQ